MHTPDTKKSTTVSAATRSRNPTVAASKKKEPWPAEASEKPGWKDEDAVAWELERRGHEIVARRLKTPWAEIDLLTRCRGELHVVEVKSLSTAEFLGARVGRRQRQRLQSARDALEGRFGGLVHLILAVRTPQGQISLFNLTSGDLE